MEGFNVLFLTGTDEHGQKIQKNEKTTKTKKFCDEISETFRSLTKILHLTNNDFIRTTEPRHFKSVNEIWNRLLKSGDVILINTVVGTLCLTKLIMMQMKLKK